MIVLKIIGIVIAAVLALIVLVLSIRLRIFAEYSEIDTHVYLQWLFLKIPLYPFEKKAKKAEEKQEAPTLAEGEKAEEQPVGEPEETVEETPAQPEEGLEEKKEEGKPQVNLLKVIYDSHGVDGLLLIVKRLVSYIGTYVGKLTRTLVIDELYVDVRCSKGDAAETAIYYGEICSALFPMMGALVSKYKVRKYDLNVYPDFLAKHSSASFAVNIHMYPIYVISISVSLVIKLLFRVVLGFIAKLVVALVKGNKSSQNTEKNESVKNK